MEKSITVISSFEFSWGAQIHQCHRYKKHGKHTALLTGLAKSWFGQYHFHFAPQTTVLQLQLSYSEPCYMLVGGEELNPGAQNSKDHP